METSRTQFITTFLEQNRIQMLRKHLQNYMQKLNVED